MIELLEILEERRGKMLQNLKKYSTDHKVLSSLKLQAGEDTSIDPTNDIEYTDSKIKHKLNFDNHDKRSSKLNNHDFGFLDEYDRKRMKLESSSETKQIDQTDSDIVTKSKKETTSFTKTFSNRHLSSALFRTISRKF